MTQTAQRPKQTEIVKPSEGGLGMVKPLLWRSRFLSNTVVAMTVRDVQTLFPGTQKSGAPPLQKAQQFLMYCAGYGVDPRIGQAYMIPFMEENRANWQMGLHYSVAMRMATESGQVLTFQIDPDPKDWPVKYPGDDFAATITILRKAPLLSVTYSARLGSVAQKYQGALSRAWAEGKVGWAHMFRVTLIRRCFREVAALGGYGAEEFGEVEPALESLAEQVEFMPPSDGADNIIEGEAEELTPAPPAPTPTPAPVAASAPTGTPAKNPWEEEGDEPEPAEAKPAEEVTEADLRAKAEQYVGALSDEEVKTNMNEQFRGRFGDAALYWKQAADAALADGKTEAEAKAVADAATEKEKPLILARTLAWTSQVLGREVKSFRGMTIADRRLLLIEHWVTTEN